LPAYPEHIRRGVSKMLMEKTASALPAETEDLGMIGMMTYHMRCVCVCRAPTPTAHAHTHTHTRTRKHEHRLHIYAESSKGAQHIKLSAYTCTHTQTLT